MRILWLRALVAGAPKVHFHPRLSVILGSSEDETEAIASVFKALCESTRPNLDALVAVNNVAVAVGPDFPSYFSVRSTPPILRMAEIGMQAPEPATGSLFGRAIESGGAVESSLSGESEESARIATLRAEQRSVGSELTVVTRELRSESFSSQTGSETNIHELAHDLESIQSKRNSSALRLAALTQLREECDAALYAARGSLDKQGPQPSRSVAEIAELERIRDEILDLSSEGGLANKRHRRRIEQLERRHAEILKRLGQPSYAAAIAAQSMEAADSGASDGDEEMARVGILLELDDWLAEAQSKIDSDNSAQQELVAAALELLGDRSAPRTEDLGLLAVRLRALRSGESGVRDRGLGGGPMGPEATELGRLARSTSRSGSFSSAASDDRVVDLASQERELTERLELLSQRIQSLERAAVVLETNPVDLRPAGAPVSETQPNSGGLIGGGLSGEESNRSTASAALASAIDRARSVAAIDALPLLVIDGPPGSPKLDPMSVLAASAASQIVWITQDPGSASAVESAEGLARVIRV